MLSSADFVKKLVDCKNHNTMYAKGCFGQPCNDASITQKSNQYPSWYYNKLDRFKALYGKNFFLFDCLGLVKAIIWGWTGDASKAFGGAVYQSNGLPDTTEDGMIGLCKDVSTDFKNIVAGELLYMKGHVGVYIGNNKVIECTTSGSGNVQETTLSYHTWLKHGKLPMIDYTAKAPAPVKKSNEEIAKEVLDGRWGNGEERKKKLEASGYNYATIQSLVNKLVKGEEKATTKTKSLEEVAKDVINGRYGNGTERKKKLEAEGYNYKEVQSLVNKLLK